MSIRYGSISVTCDNCLTTVRTPCRNAESARKHLARDGWWVSEGRGSREGTVSRRAGDIDWCPQCTAARKEALNG